MNSEASLSPEAALPGRSSLTPGFLEAGKGMLEDPACPPFTWKETRTHGEARHPVKTGFPVKGGPDGGHGLFEPLATGLQFSPDGQSGQLLARRKRQHKTQVLTSASPPDT